MPVPSALVGTAVTAAPVRVDPRWTMAFAAGVGDPSPCYLDTTRPGGVGVHPVFACAPEWPALAALRQATAHTEAAGEARRRVHWTHDITWHRMPTLPVDVVVTASIVAVFARPTGAAMLTRLDAADAAAPAAGPLWTTLLGTITRGVEVVGPDVGAATAPVAPSWDASPRPIVRRSRRVDAGAAHVFAACAQIENPIHTDVAVARSAGLAGPILHGTASLAIGVTETLAALGIDDPSRVQRVHARMRAMVPMPANLRIDTAPTAGDLVGKGGHVAFRVIVGDGEGDDDADGDGGHAPSCVEATLHLAPAKNEAAGPGLG